MIGNGVSYGNQGQRQSGDDITVCRLWKRDEVGEAALMTVPLHATCERVHSSHLVALSLVSAVLWAGAYLISGTPGVPATPAKSLWLLSRQHQGTSTTGPNNSSWFHPCFTPYQIINHFLS